jgi:hypothetical protein
MNTIICKHCGKEIEITEALLHQVEEKVKREVSKDVEQEIQKARLEAAQAAKKETEAKQSLEFESLQKQLLEQKQKNDEFRQKELELRDEKRKIEEEKKQMILDIERKMDDERKTLQERVIKEEEEKYRFKDKEKETQIENLKRMLDEAQRKASGVSQQVQGEVLEVDLEEQLISSFLTDSIEPVAKGAKGGDIVQVVKNSMGKVAGSILWETKRAKWTPSWLPKLREDARKVGATSSILVSEDLPKEIESFGFIDGVLVTTYSYAISLAVIVRRGIMQTAAAKSAAANKDETLEMVYQYLQSDAFRHRIEGYIEGISIMRVDLDSEKRSMERIWKRREMQILKAESSISKLAGELEGIMGSAFPAIKQLTLDSGFEEEKPF